MIRSSKRQGFVPAILSLAITIMLFASVGCRSSPRDPWDSVPHDLAGNIRSLFDGAVTYFDVEHVDADGNVLPPQYPRSVSPTPALEHVGAEPYHAEAELWADPTWQALGFAPDQPHRHAYRFESGGSGQDAWYSATGYTDPDGNGRYTVLRRYGAVLQESEIRPPAVILIGREMRVDSSGNVDAWPARVATRRTINRRQPVLIEGAGGGDLLTFPGDVSTISYKVVRTNLDAGHRPHPYGVRVEEFLNYFDFGYSAPDVDSSYPFAVHIEGAPTPFSGDRVLVRLGIQAEILPRPRPAMNLMFLVDVSASMRVPEKLTLIHQVLRELVDSLAPTDTIGIVTYGRGSHVALEPTEIQQRERILRAIDGLGGLWNGPGLGGMLAAYRLALGSFVEGGVNRVIWCSDGNTDVEISGDALVAAIRAARDRQVYLTTLGFGRGNYSDRWMEHYADRGNGSYAYIDSPQQARRVLGQNAGSAPETIADDLEIQIEMNGQAVLEYRLIGYEGRVLADRPIDNDSVDATAISAGHAVTMMVEVLLQPNTTLSDSDRLLTTFLRYKRPGESERVVMESTFEAGELHRTFEEASDAFRFAAAVAAFGEALLEPPEEMDTHFEAIAAVAAEATSLSGPEHVEFLELVDMAKHGSPYPSPPEPDRSNCPPPN